MNELNSEAAKLFWNWNLGWALQLPRKHRAFKKDWNWVMFRDADGPRICDIEWSKSEREKQVPYINAYVWNLEKCCWWS